jgi:hypothetical protein
MKAAQEWLDDPTRMKVLRTGYPSVDARIDKALAALLASREQALREERDSFLVTCDNRRAHD